METKRSEDIEVGDVIEVTGPSSAVRLSEIHPYNGAEFVGGESTSEWRTAKAAPDSRGYQVGITLIPGSRMHVQ